MSEVLKLGYVALCCLLLCMCAPVGSRIQNANVDDLIGQGVAHLKTGDLGAARAAFEVALQVAPVPAAIDGIGCVELLQGRFDEAEKLFIKAHQLYPNYANALVNLALVYEITSRKAEAVSLYRLALQLNPKNMHARGNFAALIADLAKEGHASAEEAQRELSRAIALGAHPITVNNLKRLEESL